MIRADASPCGRQSAAWWPRGRRSCSPPSISNEADHLADQIVVIDRGRVIARGTAEELKTQVGGERLELTVAAGFDLQGAWEALRPHSSGEVQIDSERRRLVAPLARGAQQLTTIVRDLDAAGVVLDDLALRRPTLDDVFSRSPGGLRPINMKRQRREGVHDEE